MAENNPLAPEELRQSIDALYKSGDYAGCSALIEGNLGSLYQRERWPEVFFEVLRVYQRAYPYTRTAEKLEDRLVKLLGDCGVPYVLAYLLRLPDSGISWNTDFFKNRALQCERSEDFAGACAYCDLCLKLDPANSGVYAIRGRLLDDMERHDEAEAMFRTAVALNDANHSAWHALAKHTAQADPKAALEQVDKAISLADAEATYYATKAKLLIRLENLDGALECCDTAMELAPLDAVYVFDKAELLMQDGKEVAAIALYRKAIGLDDKHLPTLWRLARFYGEEQPDMAIGYINTILSQEPENQEAKLTKGTLLMRLGETAAALDEFKQLMGVDPQCHEALAGFATILLDSDPQTALDYFNRAIPLAPKNADYRSGKARALERLEDLNGAIKEYRAVLALDKSDARAWARLASLLAPVKPKEAVDCYTQAIANAPESAYYYTCKAELLATMPNGRAEALACYLTAAELDPNNARLQLTVAGLLAEDGNAASAAGHYRQAAALDPNNAEAFYCLAKLTYDTEPEIALLHVNSAISLGGGGELAGCFFVKSKILAALGQNKQALKALQDTLRADGKNDDALAEISAMLKEESPELSLHYLNRAIELAPKKPEYIVSRGDILYSTGQFKKALEQYRQAASADVRNGAAALGTARCLDALGDDGALAAYDNAARLAPAVSECHYRKAEYLVGRGRSDEALPCYSEALRLAPETPAYLLGKAKMVDNKERPAEAAELYRAVLAKEPDNPTATARLGFLLRESQPREALLFLERAIEMHPAEPLFRMWRGDALRTLGDGESAALAYVKALSLTSDPLLSGKLRLALGDAPAALEHFKAAAALNPTSHEAAERLAFLLLAQGEPEAESALDTALTLSPQCPICNFEKAKLFHARSEPAENIIQLLDLALSAKPNFTDARKLLVAVLRKKRAFIRLALELRKLKTLSE